MANKYWKYYPKFFKQRHYIGILEDLEDKCEYYEYTSGLRPNEILISKRMSCVVTDIGVNNAKSQYFNYHDLPTFKWSDCKMLNHIRKLLEKRLGEKYDYCMCHIYVDGDDNIPYHNDREALDSDIASISFGATRKFRFRKMGENSGYYQEYKMESGDLIHMLAGCQRKFKHSVPVEKTVKNIRINLTFRKLTNDKGSSKRKK